MATFQKFYVFTEDIAEAKHNLGSDQLRIALCAAASAPVVTNSVLANLTEIAYTNLSSRNVTTTSSSQTTGTYTLVLADLTLTASGGSVATWRYAVLYNSTAAGGPLIGFWDRGVDTTLIDGDSALVDFPGGGVITIGP